MTEMIVDQEQRDKITKELTKNFLVEAGAGSGKTHSLVERMVNLIISGTFNIGQIVAITFTRKAADELKERFQSGLEKRRKQTDDLIIRQRIEKALADFDQCYLGTVHAFCARILRERPIEAGLDFDFVELDDVEDAKLADEAWERYIQHARLENQQKITELIELGFDIAELRKNMHRLREYGDVHWHYEIVEKPSLDEAFSALKNFVEDTKRSLPDEEPEKGYDSLQKKILRTIMQLKYGSIEQEKTQVAMLRPYQKASSVTLNRWKDKDEAKEIRDERQHILAEIVEPTLKRWFEYCHSKLISFLKPALAFYDQLKKERSALNFQDLLVYTAKLLRENSEVRVYFQEKYSCLLVDEFQDTDPIQAEIMLYLTGEELAEKNWTKLTPKPGSLFVVGDPKQSIYRFRRADIDIYQRVKEIISSTGGEVLHLTMNFRTITAITEPLNTVFEQHLPETETTYQAAYRPLVARNQGEQDEEKLQGIYYQEVPYSRKSSEVVEQDAENIAKYIRKMLDSKRAKPNDFMVLTRYNSNLKDYANKLEEYGIPVITTGEVPLREDEEMQALAHLMKALAMPTNSLYVTAVLRGPFFGISDRILYELSKHCQKITLFISIPETMAESDRRLLEQTFAKLKQYYRWRTQDLPTAALEKIIHDIGILPMFLGLKKSKRDFTRLYQVIERLRAYEANGNSEFHLVCDRLFEMIQEETIEEMTLPNEQNAVSVMNVHKSKGLEANIVFLAQPNKFVDTKNRILQHIKRDQDQSIGYFAFQNEKGEQLAQPCSWEEYLEEEYRYLQAEEIRLLYVAATRAKKMLIVSTMDRNNDKNNPWHLLLEGISLQPLTVYDDVDVNEPVGKERIDVQEYEQLTNELNDWTSRLARPSYSKYSPTDDTKELLLDVERESGGGIAWGKLIHEAFELVLRDEGEINKKVEQLIDKESLPPSRKSEVLEIIEVFKSSPLYKQIQSAEAYYTELPFSFMAKVGDPLYPEGKEGDVYISGIIDLIYKKGNGWVIVDFKTDRITKEEDIQKLTNHYARQLQLYREAWQHMTKEMVTELKLYFIHANQLVTL